MNQFCMHFCNDIYDIYPFYGQYFNIFNYSSMFLYVLNSCKILPEDDLGMIETYRSSDGFCLIIYIHILKCSSFVTIFSES